LVSSAEMARSGVRWLAERGTILRSCSEPVRRCVVLLLVRLHAIAAEAACGARHAERVQARLLCISDERLGSSITSEPRTMSIPDKESMIVFHRTTLWHCLGIATLVVDEITKA
jgi:hypothetical protein